MADDETNIRNHELLDLNPEEVVIDTIDEWTPLVRTPSQRRQSNDISKDIQSIRRINDRSKCPPDRSVDSVPKNAPLRGRRASSPIHLLSQQILNDRRQQDAPTDVEASDEELEHKLREVARFLVDVRANPADEEQFLCTGLSLAPQLVLLATLQRELIGALTYSTVKYMLCAYFLRVQNMRIRHYSAVLHSNEQE